MQFSFVHEFDVDPSGFWQMFFNEEYERELFKRLRMRTYVVLERKDAGNEYRRTLKLEPELAVPSWAQSVVKDTGYTEYDVLSRDRSTMDVRIEPQMMKERFNMRGTFKVTSLGAGRCRREFSGEVKISVPLLGGKIEKLMVDQMREGYDAAAEFTREWIRKHGAATPAG